MKTVPIIVVGRLAEDRTLIEPLSIITMSMHHAHPKDVRLTLQLTAADVLPEFEKDFYQAWHNLHTLQCNPPIHKSRPSSSQHTHMLLEQDIITFTIPLFQKKVRLSYQNVRLR
jgi:hypothetical protein